MRDTKMPHIVSFVVLGNDKILNKLQRKETARKEIMDRNFKLI
jgi:hypothetical protein